MKNSRLLPFTNIVLFLGFILVCASCDDKREDIRQDCFVPAMPDYHDSNMWIQLLNDKDGKGADVFYIPSTWEYDWFTSDGRVCHYADPSIEQHRSDMSIEMNGVAEYMADNNNFYSPFYRHITLDSWATLNEDTITRRYSEVSFIDVQNAFNYFIDAYNNNRPFILAGFSQGGKSVVELMKILTPDQRERLVAAYVLGYKVTPEDVSVAPWIKGAVGATDTGVVICYNSVSSVDYIKPIVASPNEYCINPVNWKTDETPDVLNDTITVTLDSRNKVLVLDGFDGSYLPNILDILNVGDYHGAEPWIYSDCLHENFKQRILNYYNTNKKATDHAIPKNNIY